MINNVPGGAIFETTVGSAASRSQDARQQAGASETPDKTSAAHDAGTPPRSTGPVTAATGGERTSDDATRGRELDISV